MSKTRRDFLRSCVALGAAGAVSQFDRFGAITAHAQTPGYKALVCIFLAGGNDSNNMIVPIDSRYAKYAAMRGPLTLSSSSLRPAGTGGLAFHPALPNIERLYNERAAAIALNVGTLMQPTTKTTLRSVALPRSLQSHSDQTQQWQSSDANGGTTGWGGRVSDVMGAMNTGGLAPGIAVSSGNSLFLSGARTAPVNVSSDTMSGLLFFGSTMPMAGRVASLQRLLSFDSGMKLVTAANDLLDNSMRAAQQVNAALSSAPALPVTFPATPIGRQLAQVAKLMSIRGPLGMNRQIFFASLGSFDHHESLLTGQHELLADLDQAVGAFCQALETLGLTDQVTLFTESEFSRTGDANATMGTDHAWGGHHLIVGGAVRGGRTFGTFPTLELGGPDDLNDRGVWIPTTSLDQYAATLGGWFGVTDEDLNGIFPNLHHFPIRRLSFLPGTLPTFSNDPLTRGTPVRAVHLTELREAIATLRSRAGLSAPVWTDAALLPGVTFIKTVHLTELRSALDDVYVAYLRTPPGYVQPGPLVSAAEFAELRNAIHEIW